MLATGSMPKPIPGTQFGGRVIGTEEAWALEELPGKIAVVGAGASGAEIASAYGRLGTEVLLFEALDRVLPTEDADISKVVGRGLAKQNIDVHTGTLVENVQSSDDKVHVLLRRPDRPRSSGSSSPPAAGPTSRASGSTRPASSSTTTG